MKIKYKLSLAICSVLVLLGIILNLSTRYIVDEKMERSICNYLDETMRSTREAIKYEVATDMAISKADALKNRAEYIGNYISLNYDCQVDIRDMEGSMYWTNIDKYEYEIKNTLNDVKQGQAIANLIYNDHGVEGILSYPVYINKSYLGMINIVKNYDSIYHEYSKMIRLITIIEVITFLAVLIAILYMTSRITKPITILTEDIKEMSNGNYSTSITAQKGKDEVAILSNEFIKMKQKISEQFTTIRVEKEKVETLANSRKQFFDNVTHEIKTPLTAITGYAEMIRDNIVDDQKFKDKAIARIYSESERLHTLVLDLISVSKGLSAIEEEKKYIDMKEIINEVCDDMKIKSDKYNLSINKQVSKGTIYGQANKIREVLINIIDNAIKYSLDNEDINILAAMNNEGYKIEVVNKAKVIPDEVYNNIFEPLVKAKDSKEPHSSGLGLFLCKEIVEEHNGYINIDNGPEVKVSVMFPKKKL